MRVRCSLYAASCRTCAFGDRGRHIRPTCQRFSTRRRKFGDRIGICQTFNVASAIEGLETRFGKKWAAIASSRFTTEKLIAALTNALSDLDDPNLSVVVTGSLGRGEASHDSDADWVLLIDGPSNPDHALLARKISDRIREVLPTDVGPTGTFGEIVVSHELVHYIAGTRDSNENLTRRVLLLSESRAVSNPLV